MYPRSSFAPCRITVRKEGQPRDHISEQAMSALHAFNRGRMSGGKSMSESRKNRYSNPYLIAASQAAFRASCVIWSPSHMIRAGVRFRVVIAWVKDWTNPGTKPTLET
jgi:hypothetical protein